MQELETSGCHLSTTDHFYKAANRAIKTSNFQQSFCISILKGCQGHMWKYLVQSCSRKCSWPFVRIWNSQHVYCWPPQISTLVFYKLLKGFLLVPLFVVVAKSHRTLFDPMDCSTPGFPVLHYLLEFPQIHPSVFCLCSVFDTPKGLLPCCC